MPAPKFTDDVPPPDGKSARARGPVTPPEAEDVVASLEPDDDLAEMAGAAPAASAPAVTRKDGEKILIHVREDGFTANGRVWYRGQELEFEVGSEPYKDTLDRSGRSWLELDENSQYKQYGRVMFGFGPWPGGQYENQRALEAERLRGRTPPTIGKLSSSRP